MAAAVKVREDELARMTAVRLRPGPTGECNFRLGLGMGLSYRASRIRAKGVFTRPIPEEQLALI